MWTRPANRPDQRSVPQPLPVQPNTEGLESGQPTSDGARCCGYFVEHQQEVADFLPADLRDVLADIARKVLEVYLVSVDGMWTEVLPPAVRQKALDSGLQFWLLG